MSEEQKNQELLIHDLLCKFCKTKTGEFSISKEVLGNRELNDKLFGIEDTRCDNCKIEHGEYNNG